MRPLAAPLAAGHRQHWAEGCRLQLDAEDGQLSAAMPPPRALSIRRATPGERLRLAPGTPARTLKNLFQEKGVPPWLRARLPVIEIDGEAQCVAGVAATAQWRDWLAQSGWQPVWTHGHAGLDSPIKL